MSRQIQRRNTETSNDHSHARRIRRYFFETISRYLLRFRLPSPLPGGDRIHIKAIIPVASSWLAQPIDKCFNWLKVQLISNAASREQSNHQVQFLSDKVANTDEEGDINSRN